MSHKAGGQHHREHVQGTVWDPTLGPDSTREKEKASVDPSSLPVVVINDSDVETTINFLVAQRAKNLLAMWETRFDPWIGKIPWRREWQPIPVFFLENSMDRGAWRATVHGLAKSWTRLSY